ncbi:MAG: phage/plasmid primase, P4 family [Alphaproteobacteria bacterium]|nr:phage/plasmid primase, P4 family [Alphaproteobacteria bacterium]
MFQHVLPRPRTTPDALALRFCGDYAGELRYVARWKRWMAWDGRSWRPDATLLAAERARAVCGRAAGDVRRTEADAKAAARLQERLAGAALPAQVERLARSDRALAAEPGQWDLDPDRLNTPVGMLDTASGETLPHDPEAYMTRITAVAPAAPGTPHPLWSGFLDRLTGGDAELAFYLQRVAGYALTGRTSEHAVFFLHGPGASGKSTFLATLARILGGYAGVMAADPFLGSPARLEAAFRRIDGVRLAAIEDAGDGARWSAARIKALAGSDAAPGAKLMIACNDRPQLGRVDEAVSRRLHLVPFAAVPEAERDPFLPDKLAAEHPAILRWAIDGALAWRRIGLSPPAAVLAARERHLADEDTLAQWLAEGTRPAPGGWASSSALYESWRRWCRDAGEPPGSQKRLSRMLEARGFQPKRRRTGHHGFLGLALGPSPAEATTASWASASGPSPPWPWSRIASSRWRSGCAPRHPSSAIAGRRPNPRPPPSTNAQEAGEARRRPSTSPG